MFKYLLLPFLFLTLVSSSSLAQSPVLKPKGKVAPVPDLVVRLSPARTYLTLNFKNLSTVKSFNYEVNYTGNNQSQGIFGQVSKVKTNLLMRQLFLGTCSKKVCISHKGVKKLTVTARFTQKNGKKTTRIVTLP
ncbi:MAG: hypothetical protein WCT01_03830 [Candidatus Shapirobacteria bacterium]|jgi:hypothetical protein